MQLYNNVCIKIINTLIRTCWPDTNKVFGNTLHNNLIRNDKEILSLHKLSNLAFTWQWTIHSCYYYLVWVKTFWLNIISSGMFCKLSAVKEWKITCLWCRLCVKHQQAPGPGQGNSDDIVRGHFLRFERWTLRHNIEHNSLITKAFWTAIHLGNVSVDLFCLHKTLDCVCIFDCLQKVFPVLWCFYWWNINTDFLVFLMLCAGAIS